VGFGNRKVGRGMGRRVMKDSFYTEVGEAVDIETIIRLRPWIEDEVRRVRGDFTSTSLVTDYNKEREIFEFKLHFHK
jgi:hypothetical protein